MMREFMWMKCKENKQVTARVFLKQTRISLSTYYLYLKANDVAELFFDVHIHFETLCDIINDIHDNKLLNSGHITTMHLDTFISHFHDEQFKIRAAFADLGEYVEKNIPLDILKIYGDKYGLSGYKKFIQMFNPLDLCMVNDHLIRVGYDGDKLNASDMIEYKNHHGIPSDVENYLQYLVDVGFFYTIKPKTIDEINMEVGFIHGCQVNYTLDELIFLRHSHDTVKRVKYYLDWALVDNKYINKYINEDNPCVMDEANTVSVGSVVDNDDNADEGKLLLKKFCTLFQLDETHVIDAIGCKLPDYNKVYLTFEMCYTLGEHFGVDKDVNFNRLFKPNSVDDFNRGLMFLLRSNYKYDYTIDKIKKMIEKPHTYSELMQEYLKHVDATVDFDDVDDVEDDKIIHKADLYNSNTCSGIESIEVTENMDYLLGNAVDLIWNAPSSKTPVEDLLRAKWFCERAKTQFTRHRVYFGSILINDAVSHMTYNAGIAVACLMNEDTKIEDDFVSNLNKAVYHIDREIEYLSNKEKNYDLHYNHFNFWRDGFCNNQ